MACATTCALRGFRQSRMPRERACVSAHSRPLSKSAGATGIVFQPFEEVQPELAVVAKKHGATDSFARSSYHEDSEAAVNEQINVQYTISYAYHSMYSYFDRDNVGLPGFAKYFKEVSDDERDHAESFIEYQNQRGGRVKLQGIVMPEMEFSNEEKGDALYAMELALSLEKLNFMKLQGLRAIADKHHDAALSDFTDNFIADQVEDIKRAAVYVSQLRRVGKGHGVWHFDQELEYGNGTV